MKTWAKKDLLIITLIIIGITFIGCSNKPETKEVKAADNNLEAYFTVNEGMTLQFLGVGNEFASFKREIKYSKDNLVQIHDDNGGTVMAKVYRVKKDKVALLREQGEFYTDRNLLSQIKDDSQAKEVILKRPLKVGSSWQTGNRKRKIVAINETITVPAGKFHDVLKIKVSIDKGEQTFEKHEYYAKNIGLIMIENLSGETEIISKLAAFSKKQAANKE